jgi:lysozyme family protein
MWGSIAVKSGQDDINTTYYAKKIIAAEEKYRDVMGEIGTPWYFIGALHMRESGCDFAGVLHNGEKIIGTGSKTKLVPAGRGPFSTWQSAAMDALRLEGFDKVNWNVLDLGALLAYKSELYNGLGYTNKGVNSPYVWAGSNHEQKGKYVADGKWDPNANDVQIGTMTVIKRLCEMRPDIAKELAGTPEAPVVPVIPSPPVAPSAPAVDPQRQVGGLLNAAYSAIQSVLKRKT